ncbi:MAG: hypothetical protein EXS08_16900 [Planctomycetes bacterium]|nr:hypothetical protein [Planctomycetota bacterium]
MVRSRHRRRLRPRRGRLGRGSRHRRARNAEHAHPRRLAGKPLRRRARRRTDPADLRLDAVARQRVSALTN